MVLSDGGRLVFQGDSITDCGRSRTGDLLPDPAARGTDLGSGYAMMAAAHLANDAIALRLDVRNLGISGNRVVDLAARMGEHGWSLRPTVLSILIGVNDTWHGFTRGAGIDLDRFAAVYDDLLTNSRRRVPGLRLVLCEPFVLACGVVVAGWRDDVDARRAVVRRLANAHGAVLVPFQDLFDEAVTRAPATHWAPDGVHPSPAGHLLMARAWLRAVGAA
jgi:acyl-CoA thioesterase I